MDQKQLTFDESVKEVMRTLPPVVHDYLVQSRYTAVVKGLMTKYGLRIDQGGVLEREIMLFLMGIDEPSEFAEALKDEAKIPEEMVRDILTDVNQQVFMPLRAEMMKSGGGGAETAKSAAPQAPRQEGQVLPQQQSVLIPANPSMPVRDNELNLLYKVAPRPPAPPPPSHIAPLPPKAAMPRPGGIAVSKPITEAAKLLEDHEEPHIEFKKETPAPPPVAPRIVAPPANLPGAIIPPPAPPAPKSYTIDPYREPIE